MRVRYSSRESSPSASRTTTSYSFGVFRLHSSISGSESRRTSWYSASPETGVLTVFRSEVSPIRQPHHHVVQLRSLQAPQLDFGERIQTDVMVFGVARDGRADRLQHLRSVAQFRRERGTAAHRTLQIAAYVDRPVGGQRPYRLRVHVVDERLRHHAKLHIAVNAAKGQVVDVQSEGRDVLSLRGVQPHPHPPV